ncbi:Thiol:disulfide interchange protein CycY [bacterium HR40]|nr:Thiol:disulfide interchange protein CycY [bacterium HR40]
MNDTDRLAARPQRRLWLYLLPLALFAVVAGFLAYGLTRDARVLPSALIDRPAPEFALPPIPGRDTHGFARTDLGGEPQLVNVWASWCVPCRAEHPLLTRLAREEGVIVDGINYKDQTEDARAFLTKLGDPFRYIGQDRDGRVAIEWGVYGVPETFVIDREGRIRYRHVGPLTPRDVEDRILPLLRELGLGAS